MDLMFILLMKKSSGKGLELLEVFDLFPGYHGGSNIELEESIEKYCKMEVKVKVINESKFGLPEYAHLGDSGMDVRANTNSPVTLKSLERYLFPTGLFMEIPEGYEIQVRPRSGLAAKFGISVLNTPGTIDSNYRGEIKVILINLSTEPYTVNPGERIAQLVLSKVEKAALDVTMSISDTSRGGTGFGNSGRF
jgi:dUTP pyrophosphatase